MLVQHLASVRVQSGQCIKALKLEFDLVLAYPADAVLPTIHPGDY
jgi:hypothetical protein